MIKEKMSYSELETELERMKTARDVLLLKVATLCGQVDVLTERVCVLSDKVAKFESKNK